MFSINDLKDQFEIQGCIIVKSYDEYGENEQEHFKGMVEELSSDDSIADKEILFMYPEQTTVHLFGKVKVVPAIVFEIEREEQ